MSVERLSDRAIEIIDELHTERLDYTSEYLPLIDAANKLDTYEDTGLEPEEIERLKGEVFGLKVDKQELEQYRALGPVDRLAAYKETGLEPEEVLPKEYAGEIMRSMILSKEYQKLGPIDRLRELAEADRDGRCVVLPAGGYADKDGENALKSAMNTCFYHNNPVTRYIADAVAEKLTREAAEAAVMEVFLWESLYE